MNGKQTLVGIVWLAFAALALFAFYRDGYNAFRLPFDSVTNTAGMIDLFIELTLVSIWMYVDARKRGTTAIPFILIALVFGSLGPLTYLFFRLGDNSAGPVFQTIPAQG